MPAPTTVREFLDLLDDSGLIDEQRLDAYLRHVRASAVLPDGPAELAQLLTRDGLLTSFQADQLLRGKRRGFTIGDYQVQRPLGSGGMASVYLCLHQATGRRVAVKVLPKDQADNDEVRKRFQREGRVLAALNHPNIVRFFEMGLDDKRYFLVMEYVDGSDLAAVVKKDGPLPIEQACDYIRQAAVGLQYIFEADLVHRDIKPGNLLLNRQGTVKIFDLGLARIFGEDQEVLTHGVLGTADFIAPEQTYDSHEVGIQADIYSLGATLYFLLTGKAPFGQGTMAQKVLNHRTKQPAPVRMLRPDVPEGLVEVVSTMMAKDPAERPQTPVEVFEALEPWE